MPSAYGTALAAPCFRRRSQLAERLKQLADKHGRWVTVSGNDIERAKRWFDRYGNAAVLLCRFIPAMRSLISIPAGMAGMKPAPFIAYTAIGSGLWAALLAYIGDSSSAPISSK